jgi:hypothetical protein
VVGGDAVTTTAVDAPEVQRYLADTVRVWLGLRAGSAIEPPALPDRLERLFLRAEEYERPQRDRWGCWDYSYSENAADGTLWSPEIDLWLAERRSELARETELEPLWPDGQRAAVCLTHDVDVVAGRLTPMQVVRAARAGFAPDGLHANPLARLARPPARAARALAGGIARAPAVRETLERSVALEAARGVVATYFFTVPPAGPWTRWDCVYAPSDRCDFRGREQTIADVMRTLVAEGFDVGLHGSFESARVSGVLEREREMLEKAVGAPVRTTRQHFLHWDVRWTPILQERGGLATDSSLGFNRNVGFRAGTSLPFRHFDLPNRRRLDLLEVPLVVQDAALLGPIGLNLGHDETRRVLAQVLDDVTAAGGVVTVVFHPDKLARPEWLALYEWTLDRATGSGAWVTSLARLAEWWRERERRILG